MLDDNKLWSLEAEAAVLGAMIVGPECIPNVLGILPVDEKCFFRPEHQTIYAALIDLYLEVDKIDAVLLRDKLKSRNELGGIAGDEDKSVEYIGRIMQSVPSAANASYYAKIVKEKSDYRNLIASVEKMGGIIKEPMPLDEQVQKVQDIALGLETGGTDTNFFTLADNAIEVAERTGQQTLIPTGFAGIDRRIQGIAAGELMILAGRPAMGKSTLALDIALKMAKSGRAILFLTLEMTKEGLIERAIAKSGKVSMWRIRQGLEGVEVDQARRAASELSELDICFCESAITPERQHSFIKNRKQRGRADVVFVDYLQLMEAGCRTSNRTEAVTVISRKLKQMALQEGVAIVALSQLNRQVEGRTDHKPRLSDLRDSGSIEQDADYVLLLHREDYYAEQEYNQQNNLTEPFEPNGDAEVIIAKARNCSTGIARLVFFGSEIKFEDRAEYGGGSGDG
jgi:replicative DNA helicase